MPPEEPEQQPQTAPRVPPDSYLGDGVYASFDGFNIVLDLRAQDPYIRIALEPSVLKNLNEYAESVRKFYEEEKTTDDGSSDEAAR